MFFLAEELVIHLNLIYYQLEFYLKKTNSNQL
jgi:hypothetical protein